MTATRPHLATARILLVQLGISLMLPHTDVIRVRQAWLTSTVMLVLLVSLVNLEHILTGLGRHVKSAMPGQRIWTLILLRHAHFVAWVLTAVMGVQNARIAMLASSIMTGIPLLHVSLVIVGNSPLVGPVTTAQFVPIARADSQT